MLQQVPYSIPKGAKIFDVVVQGVTELNTEYQSLEMFEKYPNIHVQHDDNDSL